MPVERRRRLSRCDGSKISGSPQTVVLADKKNEKIDMYDFVPVHDCIQEQNGTFLPSFDNANGRLYQRKIVDMQKF